MCMARVFSQEIGVGRKFPAPLEFALCSSRMVRGLGRGKERKITTSVTYNIFNILYYIVFVFRFVSFLLLSRARRTQRVLTTTCAVHVFIYIMQIVITYNVSRFYLSREH